MEQRKLGKYEIRATLGRGAAGIVYEAWDPIIARRVAIKTVHKPDESDVEAADMLSRCRREAQAAGRLHHPNIVGVFDYGETDEVAYIVMEFVDGRTLKAVLDSNERLAPAEIVRLMAALLAGLQYSHDNGVVHRDIKPANIMLSATGDVKIADFGIARIESSSITQIGTVLGTPAYMSPEQFMGVTADRRTDIYSAGVLLYQMVTGERPFEGTMSGIMHKALHTDPPRPSDVAETASRAFDDVVAKAMARRPEDRFESADAFARELRCAFDNEPTVVALRPGSPAAMAKAAASRRASAPVIAFCCLLLLGVAGTAVWFTQFPQQPVAEVAALAPPAAPVEPPAPAPPPVPAPVETATASMPPSRLALADARALAAGVPCSVLEVSEAGSSGDQPHFRVTGQALPGGALDAFITRLGTADRPVDVSTERLEPGQCAAVEAVADQIRHSRDHDPLKLVVPDAPVPVGGRLTVTVTVPAVADGMLNVDLYAADGTVHHLLHRTVSTGTGDVSFTAAASGPIGQHLMVASATPSGAGEPRAEIAMLSIVAAPRPTPPTPAPTPAPAPVASARSRLPGLNAARCADIVSRVQLGEVLSDADRSVLQTSCGR